VATTRSHFLRWWHSANEDLTEIDSLLLHEHEQRKPNYWATDMTVHSDNPAFVAGQQHADLFLGFSCFIFNTCQQRGIEDLFFCTREGVFFKDVFDAIFNRNAANPAIKTHLLEASRLSVFPATVLGKNGLDLSGLFRLYKKQSPVTLLRSLGLDPSDYADLFTRYHLAPNLLENETEFMNRLQGFLSDPEFKERTYSKLQDQRTSTVGYLSQRLRKIERIGFVDIGWRGTIQNSIATLMPDLHFVGMYLGLAPERNIMRPNCEKLAYGPNQNLSRDFIDLLHAVNVLEFVCLSIGGSTSCYVQNESGHRQARMHVNAGENPCIENFSIPFQQGVLSVAQATDTDTLQSRHSIGELKAKALAQWRNLVQQPPQELVDAYFSLKSNEVFGLGTTADQSATPSLKQIIAAPFFPRRRQQLVRFLTYNQWAKGMLFRRDLGQLSKAAYFVLLKSAVAYKTFKQRLQ